MTEYKELAARAEKMRAEMIAEGVNGWPNTVAMLIDGLEASEARCKRLEEARKEGDRHIAALDRIIETNIRDNGRDENRLVLRDGRVLTGEAVDITYRLLRSIQGIVQAARLALQENTNGG